ncbi:MAG TPA: methylated-DNA--[protein]-cysteine S-methyltransferase [Acidobacteriota bacterium]|nr:methylated-DNA--[protein]-cysteine S-methyltransferase [Acidobacteriota bacterium]
MYYTYEQSPVGRLLLAGSSDALKWIHFETPQGPSTPKSEWQYSDHHLTEVTRQRDAYFEGKLRTFDLPLEPDGTAFQKSVWQELLKIPYGETVSYAEIARRLSHPSATRAVGAANGRNPLPIVVPCHRVIGSSGKLTGYGGGIAIKEFLLSLERGFRGSRSLFS